MERKSPAARLHRPRTEPENHKGVSPQWEGLHKHVHPCRTEPIRFSKIHILYLTVEKIVPFTKEHTFLTFRGKIALSIEQCRATKERGSLKHNEAKVGKSCLFWSGKVACSGMSI